jgi:hypothetical protein
MSKKYKFAPRLFKKSDGQQFTPTFFPLDFVRQFLSNSLTASDEKLLGYYLAVPELQTTINYDAKLFATMRPVLKDSNDKVVEKHPVLEVLHNPNPLQNFQEFATHARVFSLIFGDGFIHNLKGFKETAALWNLPAGNSRIIPVDNNTIIYNQTDINDIIKEYEFEYNGGKITYPPEDVIHSNNLQISNDKQEDKYLKGISKIQPLTQACQNVITAYEARGILQGNSPMGILSNKSKDQAGTMPLKPGDKEELQKEMKKYGLSKEKYQYILTSMDLEFLTMAADLGKLKLFEEVEEDQRAICNAFGISVEIFLAGTTYDNKKEIDKDIYQNAIIPAAEDWLSILSKGLSLTEQGLKLVPDFSHVPALQSDLLERSKMWNQATTAMSKAYADTALTKEEYREALIKIGMINA